MKQIIIGREGNQPFVINDEYVSRQHAIFTYDERTGLMTLTDKSRPEVGTFIRMGNQFQQISQCNVDATTDIRLGPFFTFRVGQLFQSPSTPKKPTTPQKPKQEKVDIAYLRKVAENYEETKLNLEQKLANNESLKSMSLVPTLLAGAVSGVIPSLLGQQDFRENWYLVIIGPIIAIILLIVLQTYCGRTKKEILAKKSQNEKNYKISFCCPKCHVPFAGKLYENILAEGKCPKCKVEFYDSKI